MILIPRWKSRQKISFEFHLTKCAGGFLKGITHCSFTGRVMHKKLWERWVSLGSATIYLPAWSVLSGSTFRKREFISLGCCAGRVGRWRGVHLSRSKKQKGISLCRRPPELAFNLLFCYESRANANMNREKRCEEFLSLCLSTRRLNVLTHHYLPKLAYNNRLPRWVHERVGSVSCAFLMEKVSFCLVCTMK